ncbi:sigma-70 family RNA polymerase sigma factor [Altericroceibacterium spongiae]|uniref:sigma-70 family RNA polymerase sigma factor n=1 Tax=Altericroceibacterium spongiae TaxID=2320269 RepID=UPI001600B8A1|nr:sigma-70 family RNA polymerase sigma factor [Altericroceibacterium spongiae]
MPHRKDALKLFLAHRASLIRYARSIVGNVDDAEDVVQEAWLKFSSVAAKRPMAEPMSYMRTTVRNLALNGSTRKRIEARIFAPNGQTDATDVPSDSPTPESTAISRDEYARILAALEDMPERMRTAVEMHRLGAKKLKDIAAHLGISITTAHTLVLDGIEHCRAKTDRSPE